jgi:hypothetical protein
MQCLPTKAIRTAQLLHWSSSVDPEKRQWSKRRLFLMWCASLDFELGTADVPFLFQISAVEWNVYNLYLHYTWEGYNLFGFTNSQLENCLW